MPARRTKPVGYDRAHSLRKEPTPAESRLWAYLRGNKIKGVYFRRQHAIGKYVVDFCSIKRKLVIELDGSGHLAQQESDEQRTKYLESQGFTVIRFWNTQVLNDMDGVVKAIIYTLEQENVPRR